MPEIIKQDEYRYLVKREGKMRTDGLVFASEVLMKDIAGGNALQQVANVATLPGIVGKSMAMPDIHWGYGFPIGGVAAFDVEEGGVVSPGGVGYDINCGVRLLRTSLEFKEVSGHLDELSDELFRAIPSGVGSHRQQLHTPQQLRSLMVKGARWAVEQGLGYPEDCAHIEAGGAIEGARPDNVSEKAMTRGKDQIGTLGSGNHFCEVEYVEEVFLPEVAQVLGLFAGQVVVTIHTGSRGFGYQVCDDFLRVMLQAARHYGIELPDRQLCCAPVNSPEGQNYMGAMACAANYAFANRQAITHYVRQAFHKFFKGDRDALAIELVYDVAHNMAKLERHRVDGKMRNLCVHRKGATRAFPPDHPETPERYRHVGQPVLIPGDMGRYSYVLVGSSGAYEETFGSVCHGAGRVLSRHQAKQAARNRNVKEELLARQIRLRSASRSTVLEEVSEAYKDVADVVGVVEGAGLARRVAKLAPMAVIKG